MKEIKYAFRFGIVRFGFSFTTSVLAHKVKFYWLIYGKSMRRFCRKVKQEKLKSIILPINYKRK